MKWICYISITIFAFFIRLYNLSGIDKFIFDEVYYVKDGWSLGETGCEQEWAEGSDTGFFTNPNTYLDECSFVVHPPLAKLLIYIPMKLFGVSPFTMRFSALLFGTLGIFIFMLILDRLLNQVIFVSLGGFFMSIDGLNIVLSKVALLDIFVLFFILLMTLWVVIIYQKYQNNQATSLYLFLFFITSGLGMSTKFSVLWFFIGYLIFLIFIYYKQWILLLSGTFITGLTYLITWLPWFNNPKSYGKSSNNFFANIYDLFTYHLDMLGFHVNLDSTHSYGSSPFEWIFQIRPTYFEYTDMEESSVSITSLGNPVLWWVGALALIFTIVAFFIYRKFSMLLVIIGFLCGYFPWFFVPRLTFAFYAITYEPFMILSVLIFLIWLSSKTQFIGWITTIGLTILIIGISIYFYPIWSGMKIPDEYFNQLFWFNSWV